jgi:hypothetical protein
MRSPNGSIHTTQTPPPLSFYNTFNRQLASKLARRTDLFGPPIGNVKLSLSKANSYVGYVTSVRYLPTQGASVCQFIGAQCPHPPIGNADQTRCVRQ